MSDPRVACDPVLPDAVDVVEPPEPPFSVSNFQNPDFQNRRSLQAALHALAAGPAGTCTPLFDLRVPLDTSTSRTRTGRRRLEVTAHAPGGDDLDRFTLRCRRPSEPPPAARATPRSGPRRSPRTR